MEKMAYEYTCDWEWALKGYGELFVVFFCCKKGKW